MRVAETYTKILDSFYSFAPAEPQVLQAAYVQSPDEGPEALLLQFTAKRLVMTVAPDDDTLTLRSEPGILRDLSDWKRIDEVSPWRELLGREFGWGWATINQQGYCDGVMLSFDGITPNILVNVVASKLNVHRIVECRQTAAEVTNNSVGT